MRNVVQLCLASAWVNETTLSSFLQSLLREKWQIASLISRKYSLKNKFGDRRSIICLSSPLANHDILLSRVQLLLIIGLFASFPQPFRVKSSN